MMCVCVCCNCVPESLVYCSSRPSASYNDLLLLKSLLEYPAIHSAIYFKQVVDTFTALKEVSDHHDLSRMIHTLNLRSSSCLRLLETIVKSTQTAGNRLW